MITNKIWSAQVCYLHVKTYLWPCQLQTDVVTGGARPDDVLGFCSVDLETQQKGHVFVWLSVIILCSISSSCLRIIDTQILAA